MTDFLASHYDVDTIDDISRDDWDRFQADLQALITYFEISPHFKVRPTITDTVKSWDDSIRVPFRGTEIVLCRTRGMTAIKSQFEAVEDLFIRALIVIYGYHGKGKIAVIASGSEGAWSVAEVIAEQATSRVGVGSVTINVQEGRDTTTAASDSQAFAAIYDGPKCRLKIPRNINSKAEKRWFF